MPRVLKIYKNYSAASVWRPPITSSSSSTRPYCNSQDADKNFHVRRRTRKKVGKFGDGKLLRISYARALVLIRINTVRDFHPMVCFLDKNSREIHSYGIYLPAWPFSATKGRKHVLTEGLRMYRRKTSITELANRTLLVQQLVCCSRRKNITLDKFYIHVYLHYPYPLRETVL